MSPDERADVLAWRRRHGRPWHSPAHRADPGIRHFLVTGACFEHRPYIGRSPARMDEFSDGLLSAVEKGGGVTIAWCVLPNHYHALVELSDVWMLLGAIGLLHGRRSHAWNGEEGTRGRRVFFRSVERAMRSERHLLATLNYIHHNAVRHRYVERWTDWPWSSAAAYLARVGRAEAEHVWRAFPIGDYGAGWDDPHV